MGILMAVIALLLFAEITYSPETVRAAETSQTNAASTAGQSQLTADTGSRLEGDTQSQILEDIGMDDIERFLRGKGRGTGVDFGELLERLLDGDYSYCVKVIRQGVSKALFTDAASFKRGYMYVILFAVMAAVFTNISSVFGDRYISETGFFMIYLSMVTVILKTFQICSGSLKESLENLLEFMKILNASFCLSIGIANGANTAAGVYSILLAAAWLIETVFVRVLIPFIYLYMAVMVLNYLSDEPFLSKFGTLLQKTVTWTVKTVLGIVTGMNLVQGLIGPAADSLKRTIIGRTAEAVPGIGDAVAGTGDVISGTAVLIRNGIGVAGMIVCILICLLPMIRFFLFLFLYRLAGAALEPITDKRISEALTRTGDGYGLMLYLTFGSAVLFLISTAVVTTTLR